MTPEEKAIELIKRFNNEADEFLFLGKRKSKQCALICVDEIVLTTSLFIGGKVAFKNPAIDFWNEVKTEIEKL